MTCIGVDIVEISRISKAIARWGDGFLDRIYTESELELCKGKVQSLAARFAGKEAVIKALTEEGKGLFPNNIEILAEPSGKPKVHLYGKAQELARKLSIAELAISLSHSREYAVAVAIGSRE